MIFGTDLAFAFSYKLKLKAMKTILNVTVLTVILIATSCEIISETDETRIIKGDSYIGKIFEIEGDFSKNNDYTLYYTFPSNFEIYSTDVVLVYILWETTTGSNGKSIDVWRLLPQTVLLSDGVLQYNFDYTMEDVKIFLKDTTDFNKLLATETQNQIFRIAVLPAEFAKLKSVNLNNLNSIIESPSLKLDGIDKQMIPVL